MRSSVAWPALLACLLTLAGSPDRASAAAPSDLGEMTFFADATRLADGKVFAVGGTSACPTYLYAPCPWRLVLVRYLGNGRLDPSFGGDGVVTHEMAQFSDQTQSWHLGEFIVVPDGFRVGMTASRSDPVEGVKRSGAVLALGQDGSIDTSFSGDGLAETSFPVTELAIQADGRLVGAGDRFVGRLTPEGDPDHSWSDDGVAEVLHPDGQYYEFFYDLAVDNEDRVLAGGEYLTRFTEDGQLDPGFGIGGQAETAGDRRVRVEHIEVQADGSIVVGGMAYPLPPYKTPPGSALARYTAGGLIDLTFDGDGFAETCVSEFAVQPDGTIVTAEIFYYYVRYACGSRVGQDGSVLERDYGVPDGDEVFVVLRDGLILAGGDNGANFSVPGARYRTRGVVMKFRLGSGLQRPFNRAFAPELLCAGRTPTEIAMPRNIDGSAWSGDLRGTDRRDILIGSRVDDQISAIGGHDLICGGGGEDQILAGSGNDRLLGGPADDRLFGELGNDRLFGGPGVDILRGGRGRDLLRQGI